MPILFLVVLVNREKQAPSGFVSTLHIQFQLREIFSIVYQFFQYLFWILYFKIGLQLQMGTRPSCN